MGRKKKRLDRKIFPDIIYNNSDVERFINIIMISGKKTIARNIFYKSLNYIKKVYGKKNPLKIFFRALNNVAPMFWIRYKKIAGSVRSNFCNIKKFRRTSLAMRWIKNYSKARKEKFMYLKLANEIMAAYKKRGESYKKKESIHKIFNSKRNYNKN